MTVPYPAWARQIVQHHIINDHLRGHPILKHSKINWENTGETKKTVTTFSERAKAMRLMWNLYAYGFVKLTRKHANPREAMCAWCQEHAETADHVTLCKNTEIQEMHAQIHKQVIAIIIENLPGTEITEWLESAMPAIISGGPKTFADTANARIQDLAEMLDKWEPLDMWKGVVPQQLMELLDGLGMRKRMRGKAAQEIVSTLEKAATDIWILTNAEKQKQKEIEPPIHSKEQKINRLCRIDKLHYTLQEFSDLHPAHQTNIIRARQRDYHNNPDEAVLIPGDKTREYKDGFSTERIVEKHCDDKYHLKGSNPLDGVRQRTNESALQLVVRADGLTNQERGMVDRILYPTTGKGKKYVRRVRRQSCTTYIDVITDEAATSTLKLAEALQTHSCEEQPMKEGRSRTAKLPEDISDRLQILTMPVSMVERMSGRIPVRRRQKLASRRLAKKGRGPNKGTKRKEPLAGGKNRDVDITGGSRPKDRTHGGSGLNLMIGGGGGDGRGHRRAVPRRGFPK